jgi:hypothetical protein
VPLTYNAFRKLLFQWAAQNRERFHLFWPLKGGWEHWVQAEVAAYIIAEDSTYEIEREQAIYTNAQIADWLLNSQIADQRIAVELKCQRQSDLDATVFLKGIQDDINKLNANNLPPGVQGAVVGIFFSDPAFKVQDQLKHGFTMQNFYKEDESAVFAAYKGVDF